MTRERLAFLGFGEAATAFVRGLSGVIGIEGRCFDIKIEDASERAGLLSRCRTLGVAACRRPEEAVSGAAAIFSLVTADQAEIAARSVSDHLQGSPWYFDGNSCLPSTKQQAETEICRAGGRYIDMAVMAPVHPGLHRTPLMISGRDAAAAGRFLQSMDMSASVVGSEVGAASSIKLIRSIFVKGLEAATMECMLAARRAGVDEIVFSSLEASYPALDWEKLAGHVVDRMLRHGSRRAEEMAAAAAHARALGLPEPVSSGASDWQRVMGNLGIEPGGEDLETSLDRILAALERGVT